MQPVLTGAQMREFDRYAIDVIGLPSLVLMELAGRAVADAAEYLLKKRTKLPSGVLCLAGTGNNGADAIVAGRHLHERGYPVTLIILGEESKLSPDLRHQLRVANNLGLETILIDGTEALPRLFDWLSEPRVLVDGLFGTGLSRTIEGWRKTAMEALVDSPLSSVAVDIPSGLHADTGQPLGVALKAEMTVTFQFPKLGLLLEPGRSYAGQIYVEDIGLPPSQLQVVAPQTALIMDTGLIREAWPNREQNTHKGTFGHLLVVAGTPTQPGAAMLATRAALRSGAGSVSLGSDKATIARLAPALNEVMGVELGVERIETDRLMEAVSSSSALVVGPALPPDEFTRDCIKELLQTSNVPVVIDAGALRALGEQVEWMAERSAPIVLTPHPGEAAGLLGVRSSNIQGDRLSAVRLLAQRSGATVVLKGAATLVGEPNGTVAVCTKGNPGMATAGSGDVLAGIVGALLARKLPAHLAARAGVQLHAMAGDLAKVRKGEEALQASDLIDDLGPAIRAASEEAISVRAHHGLRGAYES